PTNLPASVRGRFISGRRSAVSVSERSRLAGAAPNRHPLRSEASPKNQSDDLAVTANSGFDTVGFQVLVVHLPAGPLQGGNLTSTQSRDHRVDVAARPIG